MFPAFIGQKQKLMPPTKRVLNALKPWFTKCCDSIIVIMWKHKNKCGSMKQMWETGRIRDICEKNEATGIYVHTFPHLFHSLVTVVPNHVSLNYSL